MHEQKTGSLTGWKAFFSFLAMLILLAVIPGVQAEEHTHEGWTAVEILPTASGSYYLTKDIEISSPWTIGSGVVIDLCLNDHSITMTADEKAAISISGGTLNLYDCGTTEHHYTTDTWPAKIGSGSGSFTGGYITHASGMKGQGVLMTHGVFNLHGGTIIGNRTVGGGADDLYGNGGGIRAEGGTVNMTGGAVIGNKSHFGGAALLQDYAHMNLSGGRIADNQGGYAGALYLAGGTCTMTGGTIEHNNSDRSNGGGIYIHKGHNDKYSEMEMSGGIIRNNQSSRNGGGVYVNYGSFAMSDNAEISGNAAVNDGGGVYTWRLCEMSGGKISSNTAVTGGGLFMDKGSSAVITGGSITGNTATGEVGGLCNYKGTLTLSGPVVITGNTAPESGGGVYNEGTFQISGNPDITGNTGVNGSKSNVYLYNVRNSSYMTVTGALTGAKIGVTSAKTPQAGAPIKIAEGYGTYNTADQKTVFFEMDDSETYDVIRMNDPSDKNVYVAAKVTLDYNGNGADSGNVPEAQTVTHGTTVTVSGTGSLKKAGHFFSGWGREPGSVLSGSLSMGAADREDSFYTPGDTLVMEGDITLYALWEEGHTVTWLNGDGNVLDQKNWKKDEPVPETGKTPTKEPDEQHIYAFATWDEPAADGDGNLTYKPIFTAKLRKYTVTFTDDDNSVLKAATEYEYGSIPVKPDDPSGKETEQAVLTFAGWSDGTTTYAPGTALPEVKKNTTYKAVYSMAEKPAATASAGLEAVRNTTPTAAPTAEPSVTPTATPTVAPTATPAATPAAAQTGNPTANPTTAPTAEPTATPKPVPKTGDRSNLLLWVVLFLCGILLAAALPADLHRKKK
ncbi:MAG: InlB B-repeat-containing protein [Clostridia bacterium]|nr:InlB B-repeat-containing protein [Clostridia bacterium]